LKELRKELGPDKLITAAVPGLERDMMAFTPRTVPDILDSLDFLNVMAYDLLNRRDTVTKHHTGLEASRQSLQAYMDRGAPPGKLNLGLAFYVKWVLTEKCPDAANTIGCPTQLLEDPDTGADMGRTGAFSYHDAVPWEAAESYSRAQKEGKYDEEGGGYYYWDEKETRWWTFDPPEAILRKFPSIVRDMGIGGVFAWGIGEDAAGFEHLNAVNKGVEGIQDGGDFGLGGDYAPKGEESKAQKAFRNHFEL
jgi:GH18 family chitinase